MRLRRVRVIQRTGLPETLSVSNKRVSCPHIAVSDRPVFEGPASDSVRAFLGTATTEQDGAGVSIRVQCNLLLNLMESLFLRLLIKLRGFVLAGDAGADADLCHFLAGPREDFLGIGNYVEL